MMGLLVLFELLVFKLGNQWHFIKEYILLEQVINQQLDINLERLDKFDLLKLILNGLSILNQILIQLNPKHQIKPSLIHPLPGDDSLLRGGYQIF
jgi:hypothetical protein